MGLYSNGRLLTLPINSRLTWMLIAVTNALAYYDTATITAVHMFIIQAPRLYTQKYLKSVISV
jgi:hypothetical protein